MLTDEKLVEVERIGMMDHRDIAIEGERRVFRRVVNGHHKEGKFMSVRLAATVPWCFPQIFRPA